MNPQHHDELLKHQAAIGHETRDANIKWLLVSAAALLGLILGTMLLMKVTYSHFDTQDRQQDAPRPVLAASRVGPTGPLLQRDPYTELKTFKAGEESILHGYWRHYAGDTPLDTVSIPIDRAMELLIERGLPASGASTQPAQTQPGR